MSSRSPKSQIANLDHMTCQSVSSRSQITVSSLLSYMTLMWHCHTNMTWHNLDWQMGLTEKFSFSFFFFFPFPFIFPFLLILIFFLSSPSSYVTEKGEERKKKEKKRKKKGKFLSGSYFSVKMLPRHICVACHVSTM